MACKVGHLLINHPRCLSGKSMDQWDTWHWIELLGLLARTKANAMISQQVEMKNAIQWTITYKKIRKEFEDSQSRLTFGCCISVSEKMAIMWKLWNVTFFTD